MKMSYNTVAIRELLKAVFDDEDLTHFCYDYYRSVHEKFATGMSHAQKIQLLIEHCEKYEHFDKLLTQVEKINPKQHDKFIRSIREPSYTSTENIPLEEVTDSSIDISQPGPGTIATHGGTVGGSGGVTIGGSDHSIEGGIHVSDSRK